MNVILLLEGEMTEEWKIGLPPKNDHLSTHTIPENESHINPI